MTPPIHCMQGRLLPPVDGRIQAFPADSWEREIELAPEAGIDGIEWIYEVYGEDRNPVAGETETKRLHELARDAGISVESMCADWFMDRPFVRATDGELQERTDRLRWLVERAGRAGIERIVIPFVDASAILTADDAKIATQVVAEVTPLLDTAGVELHLETSLDPTAFAALLGDLDDARVMANYDTGNSAALGYDAREEFAAYGSRIGSVHIKDRVAGGGTVPLGEGDADLRTVLRLLSDLRWSRPLVLQVARGETGQEVEKTRADAEYVRMLWDQVATRA